MGHRAISVEGLGKRYALGARAQPYRTVRESLVDLAGLPLRAASRLWGGAVGGERGQRPEFWALRDVTFDVRHGEVLGIIGRNGAGKSTLLKLLSQITAPTTGRIRTTGRVASLLEVGTGFHPELTGRENVFLNGAILGMARAEIMRKFDEIVAFSEVERFVDTPVKHYSSGMYLRLAFAVAAHLEPEILIVDEVLAVGDAEFQKKCLGQMSKVAGQGRTVLFVSHNMGAITALCSGCLLLARGRVEAIGATAGVVETYIKAGLQEQGEVVWPHQASAPGNDVIRLRAVRILSRGVVSSDVDIQDEVEVQMDFWNLKPEAHLAAHFHLLDHTGAAVLATGNMPSATLGYDGWFGRPHPAGLFRTTCTLPGNFLNEGMYRINAVVLENLAVVQARVDEVLSFTVHETGAMRKEFTGPWIGVVRPRLAWQTLLLDPSPPGAPGSTYGTAPGGVREGDTGL